MHGLGVSRTALSIAFVAAFVRCGGDVKAAPDAASNLDAALPDGSACATYSIPGDLSAFAPSYVKPPGATSACTTLAVHQGVAACLGAASTEKSCTEFKAFAATCHACLFASDGPFQRGPLGVFRNRGGCVELLDGSTGATSCGGREQGLDQCQFAACTGEQTVDECADVVTTSLGDPTCAAKATSSVCAAYATNVNGCAAAFTRCFATDEELGSVFCATP